MNVRHFHAALIAAAVVLSCHPKKPPVAGCRPASHRCDGDWRQICSPEQRWYTHGDLPCVAVGGRCTVTEAGVAACVRAPLDAAAETADATADVIVVDLPPEISFEE
jgi:hypothetical protein